MHWIFSALSFEFALLLAGASACAASAASPGAADCLDGAYDFGPAAAVVQFECLDGGANGIAVIKFCSRTTYLSNGTCTGTGSSVHCTWGSGAWRCSETANNYVAILTRLSDYVIDYKFSSDFNDGDLEGDRILRR